MTAAELILRTFLESYSSDPAILQGALTRLGMPLTVRKSHLERICSKGDAANCFWLIAEGQVGVDGGAAHIRDRKAGELIGEQAFLSARTPKGAGATRTAGLVSHGFTVLLQFDAAILDRLEPDERSLWFELLANVLNEKLEQATEQRSWLTSSVIDQERLLRKFCDNTALGAVMARLNGESKYSANRECVVWFSDISGFSAWSRGRAPEEVAKMISTLLGLQMDMIRAAGGEVDKAMGDGLMAFWFCEGSSRKGVPEEAYKCALNVVKEFAAMVADTTFSQLSIRIGLHIGPVCFGDFGTNDRISVTILGETVNHGSRFEQVHVDSVASGKLGAVRISQKFYERVIATFPALADEVDGPVEARAKDGPITVYSSR